MEESNIVDRLKYRRILIQGYYGYGNLGDDVLMITSYYLLKQRYPNADYYIFSNNRDNNYRRYIHKLLSDDIKIVDWKSRINFDLVWRGGGGVFFDFKSGGIKNIVINIFIKLIGIYAYANLFSIYKKAIGRKEVKARKQVGIGIGLGKHTASSRKFRDHCLAIANIDAIVVRDNFSWCRLKQLKFRGYSSIQTDLAFCEDLWNNVAKSDNAKSFNNKIGFILRDWDFKNQSARENLLQAASILQSKGSEISFFSFDESGDYYTIEQLKRLNFAVNVWQPKKKTLNEYLTALSLNSLLITARAHGAIIGNCLQIPSICLAIEPKLIHIHNMLPTSTELIYPPFLSTNLISLVAKITDNYNFYFNASLKELAENRKMIHSGVSQIEAYL